MPRVDRRVFLRLSATAAGVAGLGGCTGQVQPAPPSATPQPSGDDALRRAAFDSENELVALYAAAIAQLPAELGAALDVLRAQHSEHAARLLPGGSPAPQEPTAAPPASPGRSGSPGEDAPDTATAATPRPLATPPVPTAAETLATLRAAERAAVQQRQEACERAEASGLARLLCLVAASEAQHAVVLRDLRTQVER